jgi:RNA methyltransferase, TrmH family
MKTITSRDNPGFKQLLKLAQSSRERKKSHQTLIEGIHLVQSYCQTMGAPKSLVISANGTGNIEIQAVIAHSQPLVPIVLSDAMFRELSSLEAPVGIIALIETPAAVPAPESMDNCVVLEDIQDPGNLGSILRSSAAAGIDHVVLSKGCVFAWSPRVLRAAMGAHFLLNIYEQQDLMGVLGRFNGKKIAAALRGKTSLYEVDLTGPMALIIGNEGVGLSAALASLADVTATIPMPGKMESLNAAAATAICLFERVRQLKHAS